MQQKFVIVGASLAGGVAASTLREEGFDGEIVLIGTEQYPPYERPPLSKEYLRGEKPFEDQLLQPIEFYAEQAIQAHFGVRARLVNPHEKVVELENGDRLAYDKVLIATGARNRKLRIPGSDLEGIYDLRVVADADSIRAEGSSGRKAVLVGMGFIGSEVAASLRHADVEVTAIEPFKTPLFRVLGEQVGRVIEKFHHEHGVQMIFEESVAAFEGTTRVRRVMTSGGRSVDCDFVVVGVGVEPATEVVASAGVKIENGIVVDEYCKTNVEGVYAAGDVANHYHPVFGRWIRVEHWQNAINQGRAAARNMLDRHEPYDDVHWFWSDQYNYNLQYAGFHMGWDELVIRGSLEQRKFVAFYLQDSRVAAAVAINRGKDLRRSMPLIKARIELDPRKLQDENIDLRSLVRSS